MEKKTSNKKSGKDNQPEDFITWLTSQKGRWLRITEKLCSDGENYDRHFTTTVELKLLADHVGCRFSGARIYCMGEAEGLYEWAADSIYRIEEQEGAWTILESLSQGWTRKTQVQVWGEKQSPARPN